LRDLLATARSAASITRAIAAGFISAACQHTSAYVGIRQHMPAYVSIRQHTSAYTSIRQHTPASIRQHTSAYASMTRACRCSGRHT
jgi:hypothetical protein